MLNLLTLAITDKEVQKDYNQHKIKVFFEWAEAAVIFAFLTLGIQALRYWVFKSVNIP